MSRLHIKGIRKVRKGVNLSTTYSGYPYEFSMPDMEETGGDMTVNFPYMTNTAQDSIKFDRLKSVGGNLVMDIYTRTAKVLHCPKLEQVGGNFNLNAGYDASPYYMGFEILNFPLLTAIGGKLTVQSSYNMQLKNLDGFAALTSVKAIEITQLTALTDYTGLQSAFQSLASEENWTVSGNGYNPSYQDLLEGKWTK
jgi:hypothetical protein